MADTITSVEPLLDLRQAAQLLGITPRTLQEWVRMRKIPYLKIGKLTKFRLSSLHIWIDAQEVRALAPQVTVQPLSLSQKKLDLIAKLEQWNAEDATDDPQEIARREAEWGAFEKELESNRLSFPVPEV